MQKENTQTVENASEVPQIKRTKSAVRLSPCHLGCNVRKRIITLMEFHESASLTAKLICQEYKGVRITARVVMEVMVLHKCAKPATSESVIPLMRRAA